MRSAIGRMLWCIHRGRDEDTRPLAGAMRVLNLPSNAPGSTPFAVTGVSQRVRRYGPSGYARTSRPRWPSDMRWLHTDEECRRWPLTRRTAASPGACPPRSPSVLVLAQDRATRTVESTPSSAPHASDLRRPPARPLDRAPPALARRACSTNAPATPSPPTDDDSPSTWTFAGELWMSDVMHGPKVEPTGAGRRKTFLSRVYRSCTDTRDYAAHRWPGPLQVRTHRARNVGIRHSASRNAINYVGWGCADIYPPTDPTGFVYSIACCWRLCESAWLF